MGWTFGVGVPALYVLGLLSGFDAVMKSRTPQGATAWFLALVTVPFLSIPLYWVFGRSKFADYVEAVRHFDSELEDELTARHRSGLEGVSAEAVQDSSERELGELKAFGELATTPFTRGNRSRLLIDGKATYDAIFAGIESAETYILVQFYIIHDDEIGGELQKRLIAAAERGVRVYLMYDDLGCYDLPGSYLDALEDAGIEVSSFSGGRTWFARFRLNFRNHRKIVVVDGVKGYMGGLNVGDEYLGKDPDIGPWRDTHVEIEGPAVLGLQYSFARDWYYGLQELPEVHWDPACDAGDHTSLVLASGPADKIETCGLLFTHAIESAEKRLWIASPYFVPDGRVLGALQLAALRGVDVRVLMPRKSDSILFKYVPYSYLPEAERAGAEIYLYEKGFMHQKVMLVDDDYAVVGTANFDNRSFRLNFEITYMVNNEAFCKEMEEMLDKDFAESSRLKRTELEERSYGFILATQLTRLLAPIL